MLTDQQAADFDEFGLVFLPGAVPAADVAAMRERLWGFLSAMHGRKKDDPSTWTPIDGRFGRKLLARTGAFDALAEYLPEPITDVLGGAWTPPAHWGKPLVTFPSPDQAWAIPSSGWHVDSSQWSVGALSGVVAFTFLDEVRPSGGGTLVMPGSHRLTWKLCEQADGFAKTNDMKAVLAANHPWFARLWREPVCEPAHIRRYLDEGTVVDGIRLHLAELCGQPGDVVLMNERMLHVAAPNALRTPRLMLSEFVSRSSAPTT